MVSHFPHTVCGSVRRAAKGMSWFVEYTQDVFGLLYRLYNRYLYEIRKYRSKQYGCTRYCSPNTS